MVSSNSSPSHNFNQASNPLSSASSSSDTASSSSRSPGDPQEKLNYNVAFGPLRASTALSLPEAESTEIQGLETGDPYPPARRLPNLDFIPTDEGSLLGSIHTRIAALRSSASDAQSRYSQAINSSIPIDPVGNRNVRMTIANALWNSSAFFAEGEAAAQLLRYREMFAFLSQRHAEALASSSLDKAQDLVHRGQIAIAAIRIAGRDQSAYNRSLAQGHHARHSSEVSIWGWKPWREMALAEKISERRRKRAIKDREKMREIFTRKARISVGGVNQGAWSEHEDRILPPEISSIEPQARGSARTCSGWARSNPESTEKRAYYSGGSRGMGYSGVKQDDSADTSPLGSDLSGGNSTNISSPDPSKYSPGNGGPLTDGAREREIGLNISRDSGPTGWRLPPRSKSEIQWHLPVYHEVRPSSLTLTPADRRTGLVMPTTATATHANDPFLRTHTINEPSGMGYMISPLGPVLSPQISPKSVSLGISSGNDTSGSSIPTTSDMEDASFFQFPMETPSTPIAPKPSLPFSRVLLDHRKKLGGSDSSSDSTIGTSRTRYQLRKVKTVLKSLPITKIFPWSSSSEEGGRVIEGGQTSTSTESSFIDPSSSEQSWPLPCSIPPGYGLVPPPNPLKGYYHYIDEPTPQTRIHSPHLKEVGSPPHPGIKLTSPDTTSTFDQFPTTRHREGDPLTRTEKEYQEILAALAEIKRELRMRRRRRRSRGTEVERSWSSAGRGQR